MCPLQPFSLSLTCKRYATACSILACEQHLSSEERSHYTQELLQVMRETMDSGTKLICMGHDIDIEHNYCD